MQPIKKTLLLLFLSFYLFPHLLPSSICKASQVDSTNSLKWFFQDSITAKIGDEFCLIPGPILFDSTKFKSSKSSIASVDEFGLVTAKKSGTTIITATINKVSIRYHVTIVPTTIQLSHTSVTLENKQTKLLTATSSTGAKVLFKSSKKSVATIDESGIITAFKPGHTTITASCDGSKLTCKVTVKSPTVRLNHETITLYRGQSIQLAATVSSNLSPAWKTNRKSIATVDENGYVVAQKHGTATITATVDRVSKTCTITVLQPTITLDQLEVSLILGQTYQLTPSVSSGNQPAYRSSNQKVATVSKDGTITAINKGTAYITISEDGIIAKCKVIISTK